MLKVKRALISVSDKTGLEDLVKILHKLGVEIVSTGGTAKKIRELSIPVKDVSEHTGFPEMMDGRVKTLHPKIHGGLLALRTSNEHMSAAKKHEIEMIDMVVVNLYPFEKTVAKKGVTLEEAIENIDIGGPSMLRSAAKNYESVAVLMDPTSYKDTIEELKVNDGSLSKTTLKKLAREVFKRTSEYDGAIYKYLSQHPGGDIKDAKRLEDSLNLSFEKIQDLRYGENPHQRAAFYKDLSSEEDGLSDLKQLHGKELSFNNIMDLNAAVNIVREFEKPAVAIIKHTNPCGAATAESLSKAYIDALDSDRMSAFGSIVGFNGGVTKELAETVMKEADFVECIIAPSIDRDAVAIFSKKKNLRLLEMPDLNTGIEKELDFKKVKGGLLVQDADSKIIVESNLKVATKAKPSKKDIEDLLFAWSIAKHVKSNAIVLCNGTKTVGIGAGQMSRVDSVIIASRKAGERTKGSVLASDAFFPKRDAIDEAHKAGVKAIIQPGGSKRDQEIIDACNEYGIPMVFTSTRCFKH